MILWISIVHGDYSFTNGSVCHGNSCSTQTCHVTEYPDEVVVSTKAISYEEMTSALIAYLVEQWQTDFANRLTDTQWMCNEGYTQQMTEIVSRESTQICERSHEICGDGIVQHHLLEECDSWKDVQEYCDISTCKFIHPDITPPEIDLYVNTDISCDTKELQWTYMISDWSIAYSEAQFHASITCSDQDKMDLVMILGDSTDFLLRLPIWVTSTSCEIHYWMILWDVSVNKVDRFTLQDCQKDIHNSWTENEESEKEATEEDQKEEEKAEEETTKEEEMEEVGINEKTEEPTIDGSQGYTESESSWSGRESTASHDASWNSSSWWPRILMQTPSWEYFYAAEESSTVPVELKWIVSEHFIFQPVPITRIDPTPGNTQALMLDPGLWTIEFPHLLGKTWAQ